MLIVVICCIELTDRELALTSRSSIWSPAMPMMFRWIGSLRRGMNLFGNKLFVESIVARHEFGITVFSAGSFSSCFVEIHSSTSHLGSIQMDQAPIPNEVGRWREDAHSLDFARFASCGEINGSYENISWNFRQFVRGREERSSL